MTGYPEHVDLVDQQLNYLNGNSQGYKLIPEGSGLNSVLPMQHDWRPVDKDDHTHVQPSGDDIPCVKRNTQTYPQCGG